jgi:hypothetical protein
LCALTFRRRRAEFVDHILNAIALLGREARDAKRLVGIAPIPGRHAAPWAYINRSVEEMAMKAEDMAHLNLMKKQQWNVAYYAILLLAAVFAVKKAFDPLTAWERCTGTLLCVGVLAGAGLLLYFIQRDIGGHRRRIGKDATAYTRGLEFTIPLGASIFFSWCTVVYGLWRDCPCWAQ